MTPAPTPASGRKPDVSREGDPLDTSPETVDRYSTPAEQEQSSSSVRGWQSLAEKRGQELAETRSRLAAYEANDRARQLADEYPDAAELVLRDGGTLSAAMEVELAATQRGIEAARGASTSFVHPNNPVKRAQVRAEPTIKDLEREAGDKLRDYMESRF